MLHPMHVDGVNPNYVPEPMYKAIPEAGGKWNDDCVECNEEIYVNEVYMHTILAYVREFIEKGNSGSGEIKIDGVMNVKIQIEIL